MVEDISPLENEHFEWPSLHETRETQEKERKHLIHRGLVKDAERSIWVDKKTHMDTRCIYRFTKRLCILAHAGSAGHREMTTTLCILAEHV